MIVGHCRPYLDELATTCVHRVPAEASPANWLVHFARPVAARQTRVRLRARLCVIQRPDRMVLYAVFADRVAGVRLYTSRCFGECSGFARLERIIGPSACDLRRRRPKRMPLNRTSLSVRNQVRDAPQPVTSLNQSRLHAEQLPA
jgi:hypothetical protein